MPSNQESDNRFQITKKMNPSLCVICYLFFVSVVLDQVTKAFFASRDFFVLGVHFYTVKNFGLSFGINLGSSVNWAIMILALVLFVIYVTKNFHEKEVRLGGTYILAGAISNLVDRIYLGYVRDFVDLGLGFTFNLADVIIVVGILVILVYKPKIDDHV